MMENSTARKRIEEARAAHNGRAPGLRESSLARRFAVLVRSRAVHFDPQGNGGTKWVRVDDVLALLDASDDAPGAEVEREVGTWPFGIQSAAILIARTGNPNEQRESIEDWGPRLLPTDANVLATEAGRARQRLEQAIAACELAATPTPHEDGAGAEREACSECSGLGVVPDDPRNHSNLLVPCVACPTPVPHTEGVGAGDVERILLSDYVAAKQAKSRTPDRFELANIIWTASRADESTISAIGAEHVARAVIAAGWTPDRAAARAEGAREVAERVEASAQVAIASHTPFLIPESEHSIYNVRCGCTYGPDRDGDLPDLTWIDWTAHVAAQVVRAALTDPAPDTTASEEER